MSMALALEFTQQWFKEKSGWAINECGVQLEAQPAFDAGHFYVAFDDAGVETGNQQTDSLKEILSISVGIWIRPEHLQKDKRGISKLPLDKYLIGAWTLHDLERAVVAPKLGGLHQNWEFVRNLNEFSKLPNYDQGAGFNIPFVYRGRSRMETIGLDTGQSAPEAFLGYRLRFSGLAREMKLRDITTQAQG